MPTDLQRRYAEMLIKQIEDGEYIHDKDYTRLAKAIAGFNVFNQSMLDDLEINVYINWYGLTIAGVRSEFNVVATRDRKSIYVIGSLKAGDARTTAVMDAEWLALFYHRTGINPKTKYLLRNLEPRRVIQLTLELFPEDGNESIQMGVTTREPETH